MKYCAECGAALPANGRYCLLCHAPVAQPAAAVRQGGARPGPPMAVRTGRGRSATTGGSRLLGWSFLLLTVLIMAAGLYLLFGQDFNPFTRSSDPAPVADTSAPVVALLPSGTPAQGEATETLVQATSGAVTTTVPAETSPPEATPTRPPLRPTATRVPTATRTPTTTPTTIPSETPSETTSPPTATAVPRSLPRVGQHVQVGDIRYTVLTVESDGRQIASATSSYVATGTYVRVRVQEENIGVDVQTTDYPELMDAQQHRVTALRSIAVVSIVPAAERCDEIIKLEPSVPVVCQLIYDVPVDATRLVLLVAPYVDSSVVVDLGRLPPVSTVPTPTSTPSGTPTVRSGTRIGAVCVDGSHSTATGKGACAQQGGVDHWLFAP